MSILFLRQGGSAPITETTPSDNDADVSVTTRTDRDGATIRPPRVTLMTALDSLANAALADPQRGPLDVFEVKFDRMGGDEEGSLGRILAYSNRGADALAIKALIIEYDEVPLEPDIDGEDTASGTDRDGAHIRVPQLLLRTAMESLRNADLTIGSSSYRDARQAHFHTAGEQDEGWAGRVLLDQAGRGGDAYAVAQIEIEYEEVGEEQVRAEVY